MGSLGSASRVLQGSAGPLYLPGLEIRPEQRHLNFQKMDSEAEPGVAAQHQGLICWVSPGVLKVYLHGLEGEV